MIIHIDTDEKTLTIDNEFYDITYSKITLEQQNTNELVLTIVFNKKP